MSSSASSALVLFDGECNFCNRSIQFILDHEADRTTRFAASRSTPGQAALAGCGLGCQPGSIVVIEDGRCFTKSSATIQLARHLRKPWNLLGLMVVIPKPVRDLAYDFIAANRHRISRRLPQCRVAAPGDAGRFLAEKKRGREKKRGEKTGTQLDKN
jgi:predicted DCC family thiol-disulfide oxidoreductase YuxK